MSVISGQNAPVFYPPGGKDTLFIQGVKTPLKAKGQKLRPPTPVQQPFMLSIIDDKQREQLRLLDYNQTRLSNNDDKNNKISPSHVKNLAKDIKELEEKSIIDRKGGYLSQDQIKMLTREIKTFDNQKDKSQKLSREEERELEKLGVTAYEKLPGEVVKKLLESPPQENGAYKQIPLQYIKDLAEKIEALEKMGIRFNRLSAKQVHTLNKQIKALKEQGVDCHNFSPKQIQKLSDQMAVFKEVGITYNKLDSKITFESSEDEYPICKHKFFFMKKGKYTQRITEPVRRYKKIRRTFSCDWDEKPLKIDMDWNPSNICGGRLITAKPDGKKTVIPLDALGMPKPFGYIKGSLEGGSAEGRTCQKSALKRQMQIAIGLAMGVKEEDIFQLLDDYKDNITAPLHDRDLDTEIEKLIIKGEITNAWEYDDYVPDPQNPRLIDIYRQKNRLSKEYFKSLLGKKSLAEGKLPISAIKQQINHVPNPEKYLWRFNQASKFSNTTRFMVNPFMEYNKFKEPLKWARNALGRIPISRASIGDVVTFGVEAAITPLFLPSVPFLPAIL